MHLPAARTDRRQFVASGLAFFLSGLAAHAQDGGLTREKLDSLIQKTLAEPDTTPIARPARTAADCLRCTCSSCMSASARHSFS